jgi:hypothetical protein
MASNGRLIERMVPDAAPGEASARKQGQRMSGLANTALVLKSGHVYWI